jgi:hypothetical protein
MMSYSNASVYKPDQPERKSGVMKIQRRVSPPLSPLERTGNIYKNSAGNSIIKIPQGKKNTAAAPGPIFLELAGRFWQNIIELNNPNAFEGGQKT